MFKKFNSSPTISNVPKDNSSITKVLEKLKAHNQNNGSVKFSPGENGLIFKYVTNLFHATVKRDSISFLLNPKCDAIMNIMNAKVRLEIIEFITRTENGDPNPGNNLNLLPIHAPYMLDEDEEIKPMVLTESKDDFTNRKLNDWTAEYENSLYWEAYDASLWEEQVDSKQYWPCCWSGCSFS